MSGVATVQGVRHLEDQDRALLAEGPDAIVAPSIVHVAERATGWRAFDRAGWKIRPEVVHELAVRTEQEHIIAVLRSEEHTSELQSQSNLVCRLLLEKKNICQAPTSKRALDPLRRYSYSHFLSPSPALRPLQTPNAPSSVLNYLRVTSTRHYAHPPRS